MFSAGCRAPPFPASYKPERNKGMPPVNLVIGGIRAVLAAKVSK